MESLIYGIFFGLANGLSPGPTLTMVVTQTLQYNLREGIKIAFAPIIFGIVIIPLSVMILSTLSAFKYLMMFISFVGAIYLVYLGYQLIRSPENNLYKNNEPGSFKKGMLINFASPYAYLFWFTVGAPFLVHALSINILSGMVFIGSYYIFLVGSKILIAYIVEKTKLLINQSYYTIILRVLGFSFIIFAYMFVRQALQYS